MKVKKRVKKDRCREAQSRKALSRKAQLSLFFLIGVVMLAVFLMIWYANRRIAGAQLTAPTEKMVTDMLKTGAIPYYVGLCLEKHSEDGLSFIGYQGGDIYRDQFGPAPNPNRFLPLDHRVSYGVMKPLLQNGTLYPYPPGYPGGEGRSQQVPALDFRNFGRFGEVTLRKLCDTFGANRPFLFGQYISAPICLNNIYTDTLASQWQLEKFVAYHIPNCTNWTAIRQETGYNVTPIGDVNVTVRLGLTDIWIDAYIPLKIEVGGVEPVYTVGDFHAREPVRLKRIVELASLMAMYDSYQLDFNMSKQYRIFSAYYDEAMEVTITTPFKAAKIW
ncbi:TPA: hypothetical protein HA265_01610, partial [Candidatus Woesearchaeota archaeon]|nr:hypothetical protein [Candidatus Woesearchaeota archaeon]